MQLSHAIEHVQKNNFQLYNMHLIESLLFNIPITVPTKVDAMASECAHESAASIGRGDAGMAGCNEDAVPFITCIRPTAPRSCMLS